MSFFKKNLVKLYQSKCPISGAHMQENDGAHIIQRFVCLALDRKDLAHNSYNGMLLFSGFHRTYDQYRWSLDIYSLGERDNSISNEWCQLDLVVAPRFKHYYIHKYHGKPVRVPIKSLPYLWVDYQIFLDYNFHGIRGQKELINCYQEHMASETFKNLVARDDKVSLIRSQVLVSADHQSTNQTSSSNHQRLSSCLSGSRIRAVMNCVSNRYLVLDEQTPWYQSRWIPPELVDPSLIETYNDLLEQETDSDYEPTAGRKRKISEVSTLPITPYHLRTKKVDNQEADLPSDLPVDRPPTDLIDDLSSSPKMISKTEPNHSLNDSSNDEIIDVDQ